MKRMKFLFGQRRMQVLLTLAVLLLAVSVIVASGANFTSTSANPANTFTAGTLTHTNSAAGAILTAGPLMPGQTSPDGTVTITNTGDGAADFTLFMTKVTDTLGNTLITPPVPSGDGTDPLSETLDLLIVDDLGNTVYSGKLNAFPAAGKSAGNFAAGADVTYTFTVTFPDSDVSSGTNGTDNKYKQSVAAVDFQWEAVSD